MKLSSEISAVIAGGASGLGAAVARKLSSLGVKVGLFDLNEERGKVTAEETGGIFVSVDVSDIESVRKGFETVRATHGQERLMINCAGVAPGAKTYSKEGPHDPDLFKKTVNINLIGTFHCASLAADGMSREDALNEDGERGVIINTASVAAFDGQIGQIAYSASKAGVVGMTLPMARDLARDGVRVMTIAPGLFLTPMMEGFPQDLQDALSGKTPFPKRLGKPAEFADLVVHIAENSMLNGEVIRLDGAVRLEPK